MPARYVVGQPTRHRGPLPEYEDETWADWVRRQSRPVRPATRKTSPTMTTIEAAVAQMVQQKKKDAEAVTAARRPNPEGN